jgi:hypothetical protein
MSQVTIYLDPPALEAAKLAAARAQMSVSKWFAQFAEAERAHLTADRQQFWRKLTACVPTWRMTAGTFCSIQNPAQRMGEDLQRESLD